MKRLLSSVVAATLTLGSVVAADAAPAMPGKMVVAQNYDRDHRDDRGRDDRDRDDHGGDRDRDHRGESSWHRGDHYRGHGIVVSNWGRYHLRRPPYGYHWVNEGGNFVLVAIGSGIVLDFVLR